jgi:hypothetical protein
MGRCVLPDMPISTRRSAAKAERNNQGGHKRYHIGTDILHFHTSSSLLCPIVIDRPTSNRVRRHGE